MSFHAPIERAATQTEKAADLPEPCQRSLATEIARKMILWACLSTLLITGAGYWIVAERAERQALDRLGEYIDQRGRAESQIFRTAETNLAIFRDRFLKLYADPKVLPNPRFAEYFYEDESGALRLESRFFTGTVGPNGLPRNGTTGFMGRKHPPLTPELKRRLILTYEVVAELGPGWMGPFANLHASLPENALINHWPDEPWGLKADASLDMVAGAVIKATLQSENPRREPVWSGLYFDLTADEWAVTYQLPVDYQGRHLVNASHDILLDDLIARMIDDHPPGSYNLIIARNGDVVAILRSPNCTARAGGSSPSSLGLW